MNFYLGRMMLMYLQKVRSKKQIRKAQKHTDPIDPDPENWYIYIIHQR